MEIIYSTLRSPEYCDMPPSLILIYFGLWFREKQHQTEYTIWTCSKSFTDPWNRNYAVGIFRGNLNPKYSNNVDSEPNQGDNFIIIVWSLFMNLFGVVVGTCWLVWGNSFYSAHMSMGGIAAIRILHSLSIKYSFTDGLTKDSPSKLF